MNDSNSAAAPADDVPENAHVEMARELSAAVRDAIGREPRSLVPAVIFDARSH